LYPNVSDHQRWQGRQNFQRCSGVLAQVDSFLDDPLRYRRHSDDNLVDTLPSDQLTHLVTTTQHPDTVPSAAEKPRVLSRSATVMTDPTRMSPFTPSTLGSEVPLATFPPSSGTNLPRLPCRCKRGRRKNSDTARHGTVRGPGFSF